MRIMKTLPGIIVLLIGCCVAAATMAVDDPKVMELEAAAKKAYGGVAERPVNDVAGPSDGTVAKADQLTHEFRVKRETNKLYEAGFVSVLAIILLFIVLRFLSSKGPSATPHMVSATGLICIVFGTILLVLMADTESQLTASVGILGAVAGYLFRSMHQDAVEPKPKPPTESSTSSP
jgi:hypothetical protein